MAQTGPYITRDGEVFCQLEATYGTSPGALAGTDAFKHTSVIDFQRVKSRYDRDKDKDNAQASVITTVGGRSSAKWSVSCDLIPAAAGTPTEPDIKNFMIASTGAKHVATAHTTTTVGSAGTDIVLTAGGVAASGIAVGDLIAIDQDGAGNYEVRQVVTVAVGGADHIAVDRAFTTTNVATGRTVKVGVTYSLSTAALKSLNLWSFLNGNHFRHNIPGAIVQNFACDIDFSQQNPVATVKFDGVGQKLTTHATSRPTPTTAGTPLIPSVGNVWLGANKWSVVKIGLKVATRLELRANESSSLYPTGVKGTGNGSRYNVQQSLDLVYLAGTPDDGDGLFDNNETLTAYDAIVQLGTTPGQIVAWRTPKWIPDVKAGDLGSEMGLMASGRAYGTVGDDDVVIAFL